MGKKLFSVTVRGNRHTWSFHFYGDSSNLQTWRDDGLEIDEIINTIPEWAVDLGLLRPWCFFQDLFHFRNPFT